MPMQIQVIPVFFPTLVLHAFPYLIMFSIGKITLKQGKYPCFPVSCKFFLNSFCHYPQLLSCGQFFNALALPFIHIISDQLLIQQYGFPVRRLSFQIIILQVPGFLGVGWFICVCVGVLYGETNYAMGWVYFAGQTFKPPQYLLTCRMRKPLQLGQDRFALIRFVMLFSAEV